MDAYAKFLQEKLIESFNLNTNLNLIYECGVYTGDSAERMSEVINTSVKKSIFRLFDTFDGMPEVNLNFDNEHLKGDFNLTSLDFVKNRLHKYSFIDYNEGFIPDTFEQYKDDTISFAHLDVDIYQSYLDCLNFIFPRLVDMGVIACHDYNYPSCHGANFAIDKFLLENPNCKKILNPYESDKSIFLQKIL